MSAPFRTGDLYLENRWSLHSILDHVQDPETRWNNVGIFIIDRRSSDESDDEVTVCLLSDGKLQLVALETLLQHPQLQAAAHRSLASPYRGQTASQMEAYLRSFLKGEEIVQESSAFRNLLRREVGRNLGQLPTKEKKGYTNLGTVVDAKGRDLRPPGFSKGNPNSGRPLSFTPEGLVMATLAIANVVIYDPDVPLTTFQSGGSLDEIYGDEHQLSLRQPIEEKYSATEQVILAAQQEALFLIQTYLKVKRKSLVDSTNGQTPIRVAASRETFLDGLDDVENGDDIPTNDSVYVEQMSNYDRSRRKNITSKLAEIHTSDSMEKKIRQRTEQASRHARPVPGYK